MKKFYIILIALLLASGVMAQSAQPSSTCLPEGITFTTQSEIDNFQTNYPGCTEIEGNVRIFGEGYNIINLNGLSILTSFEGNLEIHGCWNLNSLTGLENVTSIGGDFCSVGNGLTSLSGLSNLTSLGGSLHIENCDLLTNLSGLDNVDAGSINSLYILNNISLSECAVQCICDYLTSPNGVVDIRNNATGCNNPPEVANTCGISLSCLPYGNYYFYSQAEIDNFLFDYSNCTELMGEVTISGYDITNLDGLSVVTFIGEGLLTIEDNPALTSLTGLDNVTFIGGDLYIDDNNSLISLLGMDNVTSIEGDVVIANNNALTNLTGLDNVTDIGGFVIFGGNANLTGLTGLEGLTSIGQYFIITANTSLMNMTGLDGLTYIGEGLVIGDLGGGGGNPALTSLTGLEGLTYIGGELNINDNGSLTSLTGLEGLTSIGGGLYIVYNNALTSLTGLDNIGAGSITELSIFDNFSLSICAIQSICDYLASPNGTIFINNNATGCNSQEEVEVACGVGLDESAVGSRQSAVNIYPNPASTTITISTPTTNYKNTFMTIIDITGKVVLQCILTQEQTVVDVSGLSQGVYFVKVMDDRTVMSQKFIKQ